MRTNGGDDHAAGEEEKGETEEEQDNREDNEPVLLRRPSFSSSFSCSSSSRSSFSSSCPSCYSNFFFLPFSWLDLIGVRPWEVWGLAVITVLLGRPPAGVRVQGGAHKYVPEV